MVNPVRVELVTLPTDEKLYGPPFEVDCPTLYPPTVHPKYADEALHERATSASPADALRAGVETCGENGKPMFAPNDVAVEVPIPICEMILCSPNEAEVEYPPGTITGAVTVKFVDEKSCAYAVYERQRKKNATAKVRRLPIQ